jgi:hypothetical protein
LFFVGFLALSTPSRPCIFPFLLVLNAFTFFILVYQISFLRFTRFL